MVSDATLDEIIQSFADCADPASRAAMTWNLLLEILSTTSLVHSSDPELVTPEVVSLRKVAAAAERHSVRMRGLVPDDSQKGTDLVR